jgi:hypothetical protein
MGITNRMVRVNVRLAQPWKNVAVRMGVTTWMGVPTPVKIITGMDSRMGITTWMGVPTQVKVITGMDIRMGITTWMENIARANSATNATRRAQFWKDVTTLTGQTQRKVAARGVAAWMGKGQM